MKGRQRISLTLKSGRVRSMSLFVKFHGGILLTISEKVQKMEKIRKKRHEKALKGKSMAVKCIAIYKRGKVVMRH